MKFTPTAAAAKAGLAIGATGLAERTRGALAAAEAKNNPSYQPIAVIELEPHEKTAALKMPRQRANREAVIELQRQLDEQLHLAACARLGLPDGTPIVPLILSGEHLLECFRVADEDADYYLLDSQPLLYAGPIKITDDGDTYQANRRIVRL